MDLIKDIANLQEKWQELLGNECLTKKAMCDLCIPFRDKYNLTDFQTLQIARKEATATQIDEWISMNNYDKVLGGSDE